MSQTSAWSLGLALYTQGKIVKTRTCLVHKGQNRQHTRTCPIHTGQNRQHTKTCRVHTGQNRQHTQTCSIHTGQNRQHTRTCLVYTGQNRQHTRTCPIHTGQNRQHTRSLCDVLNFDVKDKEDTPALDKHAWLYSDLLQALNGEHLSAVC